MRGMHPLQTRTQCIVVAADEELAAIPKHVQLHAAVEKEIDVAAGTAKEAVLEVNLQKKMRIRASLSLYLFPLQRSHRWVDWVAARGICT